MSGAELWVNAATALRRACGVVALLGLFSMHGLAVHGAVHAGHGTDPTPSVMAMAGHDPGDATTSGTHEVSASGTAQERAPGPELLGFAGVCLAVLLVGAVAALLLSQPVGVMRRAVGTPSRGWPARSRRDHDPPCLFALSIQRC